MDIESIKQSFKQISEQIKQSVPDNSMLSTLLSVLFTQFESSYSQYDTLNGMLKEQILKLETQLSDQLKVIQDQTKEIIQKLTAKLGDKNITNRKMSNENINGCQWPVSLGQPQPLFSRLFGVSILIPKNNFISQS